MAVLFGLFQEDLTHSFQGFQGVDNTGGIVGGIEDDGLGVGGDPLFQSGHVDLERGDVRGNNVEGQTGFFREGFILREIGSNGQHFAAGNGQGLQHTDQCGSGAAGDEEFLGSGVGAVAAVEIVGNGLPAGKIAHCGGVAVDLQGIGVCQDLPDGVIHLFGRGNGRVAQRIVIDIFPAHNGGTLAAVFKQIPDGGAVGTQGICFFVQHMDLPPKNDVIARSEATWQSPQVSDTPGDCHTRWDDWVAMVREESGYTSYRGFLGL